MHTEIRQCSTRSYKRMVCPDWLGNILDRLFTHELVVERELVANQCIHCLRHTNTTGLGKSFQARRYVNAISINIASVLDDIAQIDTDSKLDPARVVQISVVRFEIALHGRGTGERIRRGALDARKQRPWPLRFELERRQFANGWEL